MHVAGLVGTKLVPELANRLEERQPLDVADRAADLAQQKVDAVMARHDEFFDRVGHVRNDLDGPAEIEALAFLRDDPLIDAPGGDIVRPR